MPEQDIKKIELTEVEQNVQKDVLISKRDFNLVKGMSVDMSVCLGQGSIQVDKLFSLKAGETLTLDKEVDEPVELIIDGKVVATGNLVAVDGCFGLEIVSVQES